MSLWPTQARPLAKSVEVTPWPSRGKHHGSPWRPQRGQVSLTLEEMVSSCGLGKEGLKGHGHQAELHGQGGWWLWTNRVVTWNPAGLPFPTSFLCRLSCWVTSRKSGWWGGEWGALGPPAPSQSPHRVILRQPFPFSGLSFHICHTGGLTGSPESGKGLFQRALPPGRRFRTKGHSAGEQLRIG